jgi:hypothetical protein
MIYPKTPLAADILKQHEEMEDDLMFRVAYIPFVMSEVVWDYVDSLLLQAAQMRNSVTKKVAREIKLLKEQYDAYMSARLSTTLLQHTMQNCEFIQEEILNEVYSMMYKSAKACISELYDEEKKPEKIALEATAYVIKVSIRTLYKYDNWATCRVIERYGRCGEIVPDYFRKLSFLVNNFVLDVPISMSESWYDDNVNALYEAILNIQFTDEKPPE